MPTVVDYLDMARARSGAASDRILCEQLGVSHTFASQLRSGRFFPSEATMVKMAELAGVDPQRALLDLVMSKSTDDKTRAVWARIRQAVVVATLAGVIMLGSAPANAAGTTGHLTSDDCILSQIRRRPWFHWIKQTFTAFSSHSAISLAWGAHRGRTVSAAAEARRPLGRHNFVTAGALVR